MRRTVTALVALAVVVSMVAAAPMAVAGQAHALEDDDESDDNSDVEPGEQFAGVVAVHESEFEGEMSERTFGIKVAQSASAEAQGEAVGEQIDDVEQRLDELEERVDELEEKREAGEITEGQYQAEMAVVATERQTAANLAAQSGASAEGIEDEEILADNDINVDAIKELQDRANELGGPAVAEAAQMIAGGSAAAADAGPSIEIGVGADGEVGVDIPGMSDEEGEDADDDAEADADADADEDETTADGETETEAGADY